MSWVLDVKEDAEGFYLEFPEDLLAQSGFEIGDTLVWKDLGNGSWSITKKEPNE